MKHVRRCLLATILGVVTAILIAWAFAAWQTVPMRPRTRQSAFVLQDRPWQVTEIDVFGASDRWWLNMHADYPDQPADRVVADVVADYQMRTSIPKRIPYTTDPPTWGTLAADVLPPAEFNIGSDTAFGWPLPCMWYQMLGVVQGNKIVREELHGGIPLGAPSARIRDFHALPLRPIWSRLFLNAALFAVVWWWLLIIPGWLRRRLRHRRGACIACGYNLRCEFTAGCSECGWNRPEQGPDAATLSKS